MKLSKHSAQKSRLPSVSSKFNRAYSFCPSSCFCSSVNRYLVWVTSNLPSPSKVTRQTRRLVPPRSKARYSPVSVPSGYCRQRESVTIYIGHSHRRRRWELELVYGYSYMHLRNSLIGYRQLRTAKRAGGLTTTWSSFLRPLSRVSSKAWTIIRIRCGVTAVSQSLGDPTYRSGETRISSIDLEWFLRSAQV